MGVPGIIVARTDAESATLLDGRSDERDQAFILGATNVDLPSYKVGYLSLLRRFHEAGIEELSGHLLYAVSEEDYSAAYKWLETAGVLAVVDNLAATVLAGGQLNAASALDQAADAFVEAWQTEAGLKTYAQAVAGVMEFRESENERFELSVDEWLSFTERASLSTMKRKARDLGIRLIWDCELAKTPEGYYQIQGGIEYAIAKSLAAAPFADLLWMETKTADLADAKQFADAIHAQFPDQMLAYNLSPSFNWDTTGMSDDEMRQFPEELGKMGFVFNFITYGGHQIDGLAGEEFAAALNEDGMLALARLQRKFRLLESPYKTPQSLVGGPRLDGALSASSGRTATTKAMGAGSTQHQHLVQTEVPPRLLEEWLEIWADHNEIAGPLSVALRPNSAGSELLELAVVDKSDTVVSNLIFATIQDRQGRNILSVRDQNTFDVSLRRKRLTTLMHLFLVHRYKSDSVHYVSPTEDNRRQSQSMVKFGLFAEVQDEVGDIIVATIDHDGVQTLLDPDREAITTLIAKAGAQLTGAT